MNRVDPVEDILGTVCHGSQKFAPTLPCGFFACHKLYAPSSVHKRHQGGQLALSNQQFMAGHPSGLKK